jgi:hypothetical protein
MKQRFLIEQLEDRSVPTVTAGLVHGQLLVKGKPDGAVVITETAAGTFQVTDNGSTVGTVSGATGILVVDHDRAVPVNDNVPIDLGGFSTGSICADLGLGQNTFTVTNGTVTGNVVYRAGKGSNDVEIDAAITGTLLATTPNPADVVNINAALGGSVGGQVVENLGTSLAVSGPGQCDGPGSPDPAGDPGPFLHFGPPPGAGPLGM